MTTTRDFGSLVTQLSAMLDDECARCRAEGLDLAADLADLLANNGDETAHKLAHTFRTMAANILAPRNGRRG